MAKNVTQYDLLISCPGDIKSEIDIIDKVVDRFNQQYSDTLSISIRTRHWAKSSYPQSGGKPQELLNEQFVRDCDAAIAVFWTRFGTPTDQYGSGSEEEIEVMLREKKQVFLYFSEKPIAPSEIDNTQYEKVTAFKNKYQQLGLFSSYTNDLELERLLFAHLSQYFLTLSKVSELAHGKKAMLSLRSICEGKLQNNAYIHKFTLHSEKNSQRMLEEILELFRSIEHIKFLPYEGIGLASRMGAFQLTRPAEVDEKTRDIIKVAAEKMKIGIGENFFDLGNLVENPVGAISMLSGNTKTFEGSPDEKRKYANIIKLKKKITEMVNWAPIEKCFDGLYCIEFVLSNDGTDFDEDIDIELEFITNGLCPHYSLPVPPENSLKYACDDCSLEDLFGIEATAIYMNYESSCRPLNANSSYSAPLPYNPFSSRDYEEDYEDTMDGIFEYQYYQRGTCTVVKLHIDYIKQHMKVAFPTPIFVTDECKNIQFSIISKRNPEVVSGSIAVEWQTNDLSAEISCRSSQTV